MQDLPIVAVFCQTDGVADEAARQEKELRHGVLLLGLCGDDAGP